MTKFYTACAIVVPLLGCGAGQISGSDGGPLGGAASGITSGGATSSPSGGSPSVGSGGASVVGSAGSNANTGAGGSNVNTGSGGASTLPGGGTTTIPGSGGLAATGGANPANGGAPAAGGGTTGACTTDALPAAVQSMLSSKCAGCHGTTPLSGLPSLVTYANLTAPSTNDPSKTNAVAALARIQSTSSPMPPAPGAPATAAEISALQDFIAQNYPKATCPSGSGGSGNAGGSSSGTGGATATDPLSAAPTCTSKKTWTQGNNGSASMNPGMACVSCHKTTGGEAPTFSIAGTVYPTGHEPDLCNSTVGTAGARVVIIGADGQTLTLTPNAVGNFSSESAVKTPYQAKVTYQGRERLMLSAQTSGDCNSCHTQNGANSAPGRITVP